MPGFPSSVARLGAFPVALLVALSPVLSAAPSANRSTNVHLTYHWHLHQPIYWPENQSGTNRYQFALDSIQLKRSNTGNFYPGSSARHPRNQLWDGDGGEFDTVFSKDDRVRAYQFGGRDSIGSLGSHPDAGASVSYSGSLMENIGSLGRASYEGRYLPNWNAGYTEARGWRTTGGNPKADMVGMTFHHAFSPLLPRSVLRKEVAIFRELWWKSWGGNPDKSDHSKGFWPVEGAFSRHIIPVLREFGYEWVIVPNSHLARTVPNYMDVASRGSGGWNIDPPNRADQLGPVVPANQWYSGTRDGRGGTFPAPFAYQAHRVRHVDPETGAIAEMVAVPMCDFLSYENGYGSMGTGVIDAEIAPFNDPARPSIVLMAHDGDNAWGGGASYYQESVPGLMNEAASKGYRPTTIQQFLDDHPVPANAVVHVEDGGWVNAADDWGHPLFVNWLYPPTRSPSDPAYNANDPRTYFDLETPGWTEDWRNWAVIIAATNIVETAEQVHVGNGGEVAAWRIQEPSQPNGTNNDPNAVEQAWHYLLGGLDSGFMYYGTSLDDEVKQTLAANRAIGFARPVALSGQDRTPPTVFKPQRFPWNPGGRGWGPLTRYREVGFNGKPPYSSDFHVWTHAYDLSGIESVTLKVRVDADGRNDLATTVNETYAGGTGVGAWASIPMTRRAVPKGNVTNNPQVEFFLTPEVIADYYWAKVTGYRGVLLDYYVEAVDANGLVHRSDIQHVFVEDDGSTPSAPAAPLGVTARSDAAGEVTVSWAASPGATAYDVYAGDVIVGTTAATSFTRTGLAAGTEACHVVVARNAVGSSPASASACATVSSGGGGGGGGGGTFPTEPPAFVMDGAVDFAGYLRSSPGMTVYAAVRGTKLYVSTWSSGNSGPSDHYVFVGDAVLPAATTPAMWAKAGFVALEPGFTFLAAESTNDYAGWFNAPAGSLLAKAPTNAGQIEGVIDLVAAFGAMPERVYVASAAYGTNDGGALAAQAPTGNGDGNLDPAEFIVLPLATLVDRFGDGTYDRLDPRRGFTTGAEPGPDGALRLSWAAFPGRTYAIESSPDLETWTEIPGSETPAGATDTVLQADIVPPAGAGVFLRVVLKP